MIVMGMSHWESGACLRMSLSLDAGKGASAAQSRMDSYSGGRGGRNTKTVLSQSELLDRFKKVVVMAVDSVLFTGKLTCHFLEETRSQRTMVYYELICSCIRLFTQSLYEK